MAWLGVAGSILLIAIMLIDAFEVMILPRRVRHNYRLARIFYRVTWTIWGAMTKLLPAGKWRYGFLSGFGPLSLFALLVVWAMGLIYGFGLLHWSLDTALAHTNAAERTFFTDLYFSGTTFFTLGYGDLVPTGALGRFLSVAEAGIGFGFLAVVISYLPVLYQAFSRREIAISLLDARAGSPPTAGEFLRRLGDAEGVECVRPLLMEWERWSAELLESHLSFPVLRFYRSQHDNQSWVGALTMILDTSAIMIACVEEADIHQARLTFAMARHAAVDMILGSKLPDISAKGDRLPKEEFDRLSGVLTGAGLKLRDAATAEQRLSELRALYEPFVQALGMQLQFSVPAFLPTKTPIDNWQTSPGMVRSPDLRGLAGGVGNDEHED